MSKEWQIPVSWEMSGVVRIRADTLSEAIDRANNDDSVELPTGNYVDGSFAVSFDNLDEIRLLYNNNQPDAISVRQAIYNFMEFEKETSIIYPFASSYDQLSEESLLEIEEKCNGHIDTETIYDAIVEVIGENPQLKDSSFVAAAFAAYQKRAEQRKRPLKELIQSAGIASYDQETPSELKDREEPCEH